MLLPPVGGPGRYLGLMTGTPLPLHAVNRTGGRVLKFPPLDRAVSHAGWARPAGDRRASGASDTGPSDPSALRSKWSARIPRGRASPEPAAVPAKAGGGRAALCPAPPPASGSTRTA